MTEKNHNSLTLTVGAECCITNASKPLIDVLKQKLTLENPKYQDARKYGRWIGKKLKPFLYFFDIVPNGICFPRGFAKQAIMLCRKTMDEDPQIRDNRRTLPEVDFTFQGQLRPYQKEAVQAALQREFGVIESGTGSGKTIIALAIIAQRQQPTLVLVHTKELLYQWAARVEEFLGISPGLLGDGHNDIQPVTIGIVNSARSRLADLPQYFGHICVDECHRVPASLFTEVVKAFDCRYSLGLSATAFRRDGLTRLIYYSLGDRVHQVDEVELQTTGAVLKPDYIQIETGFTYNYRGEYQAVLQALTLDEGRNRQIVADILREVRSNKGTVLVVSDRVAHCERLAELLQEENKAIGGDPIRTAVLTGKLPTEERSTIVESIKGGDVDVLFSTIQLIGEGFDCPGLDMLFLTTPIKFTGRLLQVVGRILRPAVNKQPKVFDYVDPVGVLKSSATARRKTFQDEKQITLP
jgi:superfamily II DNA or RNA helicase